MSKGTENPRVVLKKKYYVGSQSMVEGGQAHHFMRAKLEDCIQEAAQRLEEKGLEELYIVEVIAIVKRASRPVIVQEVI